MSNIRAKVSNLTSKVIYNYMLQRLYKKSTNPHIIEYYRSKKGFENSLL